MKRGFFYTITCALLVSVSAGVHAQTSSFFELSVGGGYSSMLCDKGAALPEGLNMSAPGSYAYTAHFAYGLRFNPYVGLSIGADFSRYGGSTRLWGSRTWFGVLDTDGVPYDHTTTLHNFVEQQEVHYLEVPLALHFFVPLDNCGIQFQIGAKYALPLMQQAYLKGDLTHTGYYSNPKWTASNIPNHGFYHESLWQSDLALKANWNVMAFAKVGVSVPVSKNTRFYANVYANYGVFNSYNLPSERQDIGWQNDRPGQQKNHHFMLPYNGIFYTHLVGSSIHPLQVGAELGFRFIIPHKKKEPCLCYMWN